MVVFTRLTKKTAYPLPELKLSQMELLTGIVLVMRSQAQKSSRTKFSAATFFTAISIVLITLEKSLVMQAASLFITE